MIRFHRPLQLIVATAIAATTATACHKADNGKPAMNAAAAATFAHEEQAWRDKRRSDLLKPEGWTSLIGLHWLDPGSHYIGSAGGNGIQLSMGPAHLGMVSIDGHQVRFVPDTSAELTVDGKPLAGST